MPYGIYSGAQINSDWPGSGLGNETKETEAPQWEFPDAGGLIRVEFNIVTPHMLKEI